MKSLLTLKKQIDDFLNKLVDVGRRNYILWSIERSKRFKEMEREIYQSFLIQTLQFLKTDVWENIRSRIGKQDEEIWTETDEIQIRDEVDKKFKSLFDFLPMIVWMSFFIWLANKGGQAFLDKAKIKGEFDLKDIGVIEGLGKKTDLLINGVDITTKAWLANQIINGKKEKLKDIEIANNIREKISVTYKHRAEKVARTESADIVNRMEFETAIRNQATGKRWRTAGMNICPICEANEQDGLVGISASFNSGNLRPPAHANCKCLLEFDVPLIITNQGGWTGE